MAFFRYSVRSPSTRPYIFIVGAPRSGTTLLQVLVGAHTQVVACPGESAIFSWIDLFDAERCYGGLSSAEIKKLVRDSRNIVEFYESFSREILGESNKLFLEKTPQHVNHLKWLLKLFPESLFINIYRDGRDCFLSAEANPDVIQNTDVKKFARYWKKCIQSRLRCDGGSRLMDVRYEELVSSPQAVVSSVMAAVGLGFETQQMNWLHRKRDNRSKSIAFTKLAEPIENSSVDRWKSGLSRSQQEIFRRIAGAELRALGYAR